MSDLQLSLVLSGGGAKGAYQVGVIKAIVELGGQLNSIAGASIGAMNGALLATAPSLSEGVRRMEEVWLTLAESSPLSPNFKLVSSSNLILLAAVGLRLNGLNILTQVARQAQTILGMRMPEWGTAWFALTKQLDNGLLADAPLTKLINRYIDLDALEGGLPLYISVYPSKGAIGDFLSCAMAELNLIESKHSEFLHIQSIPREIRHEVLLASAAIPLLFASRSIDGKSYSDGGQGGWSKKQGNTPIDPLLKAGYRFIVVTHITDGSLWSRRDFPDATIIEIRPQSNIGRGSPHDLLSFDSRKIPSWIDQGYADAMYSLERIIKFSSTWANLRDSERLIDESEIEFNKFDTELADAMLRLNGCVK